MLPSPTDTYASSMRKQDESQMEVDENSQEEPVLMMDTDKPEENVPPVSVPIADSDAPPADTEKENTVDGKKRKNSMSDKRYRNLTRSSMRVKKLQVINQEQEDEKPRELDDLLEINDTLPEGVQFSTFGSTFMYPDVDSRQLLKQINDDIGMKSFVFSNREKEKKLDWLM